ncbi:O-antigen ligase family protein [Methylomonas rosea]|uniref:O-antigen ligase-related domain-containing protein n=1 Tax=Methylomonas rosea TaxID=2952227 RepID=A0ABT1TYU5_9GAMM|nr:O-antigen ligase family protein [Methylomonas sp. WSC-7]MCQ8119700.1 hypothetical protein [Methylomonas sp. WSC-7]
MPQNNSMILSSNKNSSASVDVEKNYYLKVDRIGFGFFEILAFFCGLPYFYTINVFGELYATELLLPVTAVILVFFRGERTVFKEKLFWMFLFSIIMMIVGYMVSDLMAGTSKSNYIRAWGRNIILLSDFISLSIIVAANKKYAWWYVFGLALGSILYLRLTGVPFNNAYWKIEYSQPVLLLVFVVGNFLPNFLKVWLAVLIGVFSFYMDGRSFGVICLLLAAMLWVRLGNQDGLRISGKVLLNIALSGAILFSIVVSVLEQTDQEFSARREASSLSRFAAIKIALIAIGDSPIIGYGSWGEGTKKYADMLYEQTVREQREVRQSNIRRGKSFLAHSQILQSWMEGGILAVQLFMFYGFQLLVALKNLITIRRLDYVYLIYGFFMLISLWHLFMSPYSGNHRVNIAIAIAIICAVNAGSIHKKQN